MEYLFGFIGILTLAAFLGAISEKFLYRSTNVTQTILCSDVSCDYLHARIQAIEGVIRQDDGSPRYLAIGDSITELASLPHICGRRPINAGIGWATTETFEKWGRRLADLSQPDFVVIALGTNDALRHKAEGFQTRLSALISSLDRWPLIVVPLPPGQGVPDAARLNASIESLKVTKAAKLEHVDTTDGIHLTQPSYVGWTETIASAASKAICPQPPSAHQ